MPYRPPRPPTQQTAYNRELQDKYGATRRVPQSRPAPESHPPSAAGSAAAISGPDVPARLKELAQLHADGALTDEEFTAAKARVLEPTPGGS